MSRKFQPGQKVRCIYKGQWKCPGCFSPIQGPAYGDIVHVGEYPASINLITLEEYSKPDAHGISLYFDSGFEPVEEVGEEEGVSTEQIAELLEILEPMEV